MRLPKILVLTWLPNRATGGGNKGEFQGPFPPVVVPQAALKRSCRSNRVTRGLTCGIKSARRKERDAFLGLDGPCRNMPSQCEPVLGVGEVTATPRTEPLRREGVTRDSHALSF